MALDFSIEPYFDDYNEDKKFYKILFRPGYSVQARELNQLQTIIQKQIERQGTHLFKEGSMVIPGQVSIDPNTPYIKADVLLNVSVELFVGKTIISTTGVSAVVICVKKATTNDPQPVFCIKYTSGGIKDGVNIKTFLKGEVLSTIETNPIDVKTITVLNDLVYSGVSATATITRGVFYTKNSFVLVDKQTIIIDVDAKNINKLVGLKVIESVVKPEKDETLLDNSQNSYNYAAPGAHRYCIDCVLTSRELNSIVDVDFIQLVVIKDSVIQEIVNKTTYNIIADELARRTYDESGNYVTSNFSFDIRENRSNNRGAWENNKYFLAGDVVNYADANNILKYYVAKYDHAKESSINLNKWVLVSNRNRYYNNGLNPVLPDLDTKANNELMESKFLVVVGSGKAYVKGYEIEKLATSYVEVDKARESGIEGSLIVNAEYGNYVVVENISNIPFSMNSSDSKFIDVLLFNRYTNVAGVSNGTQIGSAKVKTIKYHSGNLYDSTAKLKLFLFDVKINTDYNFSNVKQVYSVVGTNKFSADITPNKIPLQGKVNTAVSSVEGFGTSFLNDFNVNDYISINDKNYLITGISSNSLLTISTVFASTEFGINYYKPYSAITEPNQGSLIFPLADTAVKNISGLSYKTNTLKYITSSLATTVNGVSVSKLILASTSDSEQFASYDGNPNDYLVFNIDQNIRVQPLSVTTEQTSSGNKITINVAGSMANKQFSVFCPILKNINVKLKEKTITSNYTTTIANSTALDNKIKNKDKIYLGKTDGISVSSITANGLDVTSKFDFFGGQTDVYYGTSYIVFNRSKANADSLNGKPLVITFNYYEHSTGDYFSVNSYRDLYKNIPYYNNISLRDALDFRLNADSTSQASQSFLNYGGDIISYGSEITASYEYYLPRKSKIILNKNGDLLNRDGKSSLNPTEPLGDNNSIPLCSLYIMPYTFDVDSEVGVKFYDNRRYTMSDIGNLEKRISNVEYYTTLSLTEEQTKNSSIIDDYGLDRFKNGFIIDSFNEKNSSAADKSSVDHNCSVVGGMLRPSFARTELKFADVIRTKSKRDDKGYMLTNGNNPVLCLKVDAHVTIVENLRATRVELVDPFSFYTFIGISKLTPSQDIYTNVRTKTEKVGDVTAYKSTLAVISKTLNEDAGYTSNLDVDQLSDGDNIVSSKEDPDRLRGKYIFSSEWSDWVVTTKSSSTTNATTSIGIGAKSGGDKEFGLKANAGQIETYLTKSLGVTNISEYSSEMNRITGNKGKTDITISTSTTETEKTKTRDVTTVEKILTDTKTTTETLSVKATPNARRRLVLNQVHGLTPNSLYHFYFNETKKSGAVILPYKIYTTSKVDFNVTENSGNAYKYEPIRNTSDEEIDIANDTGMVDYSAYLNVGDTLDFTTSNGVKYGAIVVGEGNDTGGDFIYAINLKLLDGTNYIKPSDTELTPIVNSTISGTISGATTTVKSISRLTSLTTDNMGDLVFGLMIPSGTPVGNIEFALFDNKGSDYTTAKMLSSSYATSIYKAESYLQQDIKTITSVYGAVVLTTPQDRTVEGKSKVSSTITCWGDPLAYSFLVTGFPDNSQSVLNQPYADWNVTSYNDDGCFLSKVDIFFAEKENGVPVTLQIREMENGYPGKTILPGSTVKMNASQVNVSMSGLSATTFIFDMPVFVKNNTEYCVVLIANSNKYKVWVSQMGEQDYFTKEIITKQPYAGVLFKSQNNSTWTADQLQDLTIKIYRAKFKTNAVATVELENVQIGEDVVYNPFQVITGSNLVRVHQPNHGLMQSDKVLINGIRLKGYGSVYGESGAANTYTLYGSASDVINANNIYTSIKTMFTNGQCAVNAAIFIDGVFIGTVVEIKNDTEMTINKAAVGVLSTTTPKAWTYINPVAGISAYDLYTKNGKYYIVQEVTDLNRYIIEFPTNCNVTNDVGEYVKIVSNIQFDVIHPNVIHQNFNSTSLKMYYKGLTGKSVNGTQEPYMITDRFELPIDDNQKNITLKRPLLITNIGNERKNGLRLSSYDTTAFNSGIISFDMLTTSDAVTPMINYNDLSLTLISNMIDSPSQDKNNIVLDSLLVLTSANISFNGTNKITFSTVTDNTKILSIRSGQYIIVSYNTTASPPVQVKKQVLVTNVASDGTYIETDTIFTATGVDFSVVTITALEGFFDDITPYGSSSFCKYVTKKIDFINPSTYLKIFVSANVPVDSNIDVYYKLGFIESLEDFDSVEYVRANYTFLKSTSGVIMDNTIELKDLKEFTAATVKLVLTSTNSSKVPVATDLRIIACA